MCRALKVLCAAGDGERLLELRRAAVSVHWELTAGATSVDELVRLADELRPDIVVIDEALGDPAIARVRQVLPGVRIVAAGGPLAGADAAADLDELRDAVLGLPPVGGPVRG